MTNTKKSVKTTGKRRNIHEEIMDSSQFTVGVVSELNRHRNAVVNAMVGNVIIPPMSSTLIRLTYGLQPHAQVIKHNGIVTDVSIDEIVDHIVLNSDMRIAEETKEMVVYYP